MMRSLTQKIVLFFLSFLLTIGFAPVVAQVQQPQNLIQSQNTGLQRVQEAKSLYETGRFTEAISVLQQAEKDFEKKGDRINQAMVLSNLASCFASLYQWEEAEHAIASSLALLPSAPQSLDHKRILAQTLEIKAQLQLERGQVQDALDTRVQVTQFYHEIGAKEPLILSKINQSLAMQNLGLYPRACQTLLEALDRQTEACEISEPDLDILKNQPVSLATVRLSNTLGHVLRVLGQLKESQQILEIGLGIAQKLGIPQEQAAVYLNLGNTVRALAHQLDLDPQQHDQFEQEVLSAYAEAQRLATRPETQIQAQLNQLSLFINNQDWQASERIWRSLQSQVNQFPANQAGLTAKINLVQSLIKLALSPQATPTFNEINLILNQALDEANRSGNTRIQAYALGTQGHLAELQNQTSQAEVLTSQALSLAPAFQYPDIAYQFYWQMGRIKKAQDLTTEAINSYSQAVKILATLRGDLVTVNPEVQFSFRESVEPIYRELVGLLLEDASPSQEQLKEARQTIESLQLAELDNFFRDTCADTQATLIDEIDPESAVIYPIILSDRLEVIVSIPGQPLQHHSIPKSQTELDDIFKRARASLRRTAFAQERLPLVQQIYDWLIRPVEQDLAQNQIKTLVFILDGSLRNLPMATLHDGQNYLIQNYNIALTPGLQLFDPQPLAKRQLKALTAALTEARQGFPALPGVAQEIEQITEKIPTNRLLNQQFIAKALQQEIKSQPVPVIHLATHGQFSSNAENTFILTWDERVNVKEFDQLLRSRSQEKQSPIELLILSACETAAGDERAALGLAGMAIRSGARSTLATLWQVNDQSTAIFMAQFYRELTQSNTSKAEALRNAQLSLLQSSQYQNPYFWAPFVLVGNWQ